MKSDEFFINLKWYLLKQMNTIFLTDFHSFRTYQYWK